MSWDIAGWVGCEYRPAGETDAGLGWLKRLAGRQDYAARYGTME